MYCLYSAWNSGSKANDRQSVENLASVKGVQNKIRTFKTWKHREFVDIPQTVISAVRGIDLKDRHLEFTPKGGETVRD